jgi:hypothetical protein
MLTLQFAAIYDNAIFALGVAPQFINMKNIWSGASYRNLQKSLALRCFKKDAFLLS